MKRAKRPPFPWALAALFVLIALGVIVGGVWFYRRQEQQMRSGVEADLEAITQMKVSQIVSWRNERLGDGSILMNDRFLAETIGAWLSQPRADTSARISDSLRSFEQYYQYGGILLVDTQGNALLSLNDAPHALAAEAQEDMQTALRERRPILTDLHFMADGNEPHLDVIAPLFAPGSDPRQPLGAVILHIDAGQYLYPLIQSWPLPSGSAETLLVRRDGDDVLYLNELRHQSGTALKLRIPLNRTDLPAVRAALGQRGVFAGVDYRGVAVLSASEPIPDSPWFMIAKVDTAEALAPARASTSLILALTLGALLTVLSAAGLFYQRAQRAHEQSLRQAEAERVALTRHFEYLVRYANDIILLADENLRFIEANDAALRAYGYSRDEMLALSIPDLEAAEDSAVVQSGFQSRGPSGSYRREALHRRKDGSLLPLEISVQALEVEGRQYVQSIARDISERKRAEEALRESEEKYRLVVENATEAIYVLQEGVFVFANAACARAAGMSAAELIGKPMSAFNPEAERALAMDYHLRTLRGEIPTGQREIRVQLRGRERWLSLSNARVQWNGRPAVLCFATDVSERKQAEEALQRLSARHETLLAEIPDIVMEVDANKVYTWANPAGYEFFGADVIGKEAASYFVGEQETYAKVQPLFDGAAGTFYVESWQRRKDGERRLLGWWCRAAENAERQAVGALSSARDITEQRKMEDALRESEERFRGIFEHSTVGKSLTVSTARRTTDQGQSGARQHAGSQHRRAADHQLWRDHPPG